MGTGRFVLLVVLLTSGFGALPLPGDGPLRTAGKIALVLAAAIYVSRPENRRRVRAVAAASAGKSDTPPTARHGEQRRTVFFLALAAVLTATLLALAIFDGPRLREIFSLLDALLRYPEVDAYLWLLSLAIAGRSWRLELNRTRALRRANRDPSPAGAVD
jgi:hypothetical protein